MSDFSNNASKQGTKFTCPHILAVSERNVYFENWGWGIVAKMMKGRVLRIFVRG